jgi:hypothetical protein
VWVQVVSTTGVPLDEVEPGATAHASCCLPRRLEQWELLFEKKKVEARFWATELEAAAAEVVTVVANLGVSGVQQARARERERSAREAIEALQRQAKGAIRCRLACARSRAVVPLAEEGGISPRDVDMASYPLTLLSAAPRVVPWEAAEAEGVEDLSHGKSPRDAFVAQARHVTAEAALLDCNTAQSADGASALLDSDTTQSANGAAALTDSDTTQSAEVGAGTDAESTASDDSGQGRAPDYKPACIFTHGGPSTEAVEAHRKRQLEHVDEAEQPKKKQKKQQPITNYLAATTAEHEGAAGEPGGAAQEVCPLCSQEATDRCKGGLCEECCQSNRGGGPFNCCRGGGGETDSGAEEDVPVCDHRMLICRQGYSLKKDFSYIPECPDCGLLIRVGHLGFCPDKCGCGDYLTAYPPSP